jgi:hypothetical protein
LDIVAAAMNLQNPQERPLLVSLFIPAATAAGVVGVALLHFSLRLLYISQMKRTFAGLAAVVGAGDMAASPQWSKSSRQETMGPAGPSVQGRV